MNVRPFQTTLDALLPLAHRHTILSSIPTPHIPLPNLAQKDLCQRILFCFLGFSGFLLS